MAICEKCGRRYNELYAAGKFISEAGTPLPVNYEQLQSYLCGDCAPEAYEARQYYETCEHCGKSFYPDDELLAFAQLYPNLPPTDMYRFGVSCADCAAFLLCQNRE